jgi:hypothetical protein
MRSPPADDRVHGRRRFTGRDPDEDHRTSTPLELLYDLTIVVALGTAADQLAHDIAEVTPLRARGHHRGLRDARAWAHGARARAIVRARTGPT